MNKMRIRPAVSSDLPQCASICCAAWLDSPVNEYLLPGRHVHPTAYHKYYLRSLKQGLEDKRCILLVAEIGEKEDRQVVGYVNWYRSGDSEETKRKWDNHDKSRPLLKRTISTILSSSAVDYAYLLFNPATSLPRNLSYGKGDEVYYSKNDTAPEESWTLAYLAVSPSHQKKGIGAELCQWGMKKAEEEGICAFLLSTISGKRLYEKVGFRVVGEWRWAKGGDDRLMTIMRWDPPSNNETIQPGIAGVGSGMGTLKNK